MIPDDRGSISDGLRHLVHDVAHGQPVLGVGEAVRAAGTAWPKDPAPPQVAAGLARQKPRPIFCSSGNPTEAKTWSGPKVRDGAGRLRPAPGVSSGSGGPPSTVPMRPAYSRDSEVAFVMPLPPGHLGGVPGGAVHPDRGPGRRRPC